MRQVGIGTDWKNVNGGQLAIGGDWKDVARIQIGVNVGSELEPVLEWRFAAVWDIPAGPKPTLAQTGPNPTEPDVTASWTNVPGNEGLSIQVSWERNSVEFTEANLAPGSTQHTLGPENWTLGDVIRARVRYFSGDQFGDFGAWSESLTYQPE